MNKLIIFGNTTMASYNYQCALNDMGIIHVKGKDAHSFLQTQFTCDIATIAPTQGALGARCNLKGRVLSLCEIIQTNPNHYLLLLPKSLIEPTLKSLHKYILRHKVTLTANNDELHIIGLIINDSNTSTLPDALTLPTDRWAVYTHDFSILKIPGSNHYRLVADKATLESLKASWLGSFKPLQHTLWNQQQIMGQYPWLSPGTRGTYLPQELNLEALEGIDYTKGCYIGQEIISRTHFLGKLKKALTPITADIELSEGDVIHAEERSCGTVVCASGNLALALIQQQALDKPLITKGHRIKVQSTQSN